MFLGHFGAGFAGKALDQRPSLGTLFFASQFIDLLWPLLLILGIEKVKINSESTVVTTLDFIYYPFSHSLIAVLIWALLFGGIYYLIKKNIKTSVLLGVLVLSHWILDLIVHKPDLPLTTSNEYLVGFGIWNSLILTLIVEFLFFITGAYLYLRYTTQKNRKGIFIIWSLLIFLTIVYIANVFGPPPPESESIGYIGLSQWLIVAWGYWADKNRLNR